jgi:hypothetical protein
MLFTILIPSGDKFKNFQTKGKKGKKAVSPIVYPC